MGVLILLYVNISHKQTVEHIKGWTKGWTNDFTNNSY